jgi:hypothetical protein
VSTIVATTDRCGPVLGVIVLQADGHDRLGGVDVQFQAIWGGLLYLN